MEILRSETELLASSIKSVQYDTDRLRASIEAAMSGRRPGWWLERVVPRPPKWAIATVSALVLTLSILLYIPVRMGASPLYKAAADNHRTCLEESDKPEWARSQIAIESLQSMFLDQSGRPPVHIGNDLILARARVCDLDGRKFLHLVYVKREGGEVSLFVGRNRGVLPPGDHSVRLGEYAVQQTDVANMDITSAQVGDHLLISMSNREGESAAVMLAALAQMGS